MGKRSIPIWLITAFVLFGITLIWVTMVMAYWPAENILRIQEAHRLGGCLFQIVRPNIVPVDQPVDLEITLQSSPNCTLPVTLVLRVPPTLIVQEPSSEKPGRIVLSFSAEGQTWRLRLKNAQFVRGFKADKKIDLAKEGTVPASANADNIPITVEGTLRAKLLQTGKEFPIFPLVTLFFSLAAFYLQYKQQEIKERERREAANRVGNLWEQMRQAIRSGDIQLAKNVLKSIREENLSASLKKPGEVEIAERLLRIAEGELHSWTEPFPPPGWTSEAATALIYAVRYYPNDRATLLRLLRTFPLDALDKEQRETFEEVRNEFSNTSIVERRWPPGPKGAEYTKNAFDIFPQVAQAEKEEAALFSWQVGFFYSHHPIYGQLQSGGIYLVEGEAGSGRTALSLALGRYHLLTDGVYSFGCYLPYAAQIDRLHQALAARLLEFIEMNPSQLISLENPQRQLLARFLGTTLGTSVVQARLSAALDKQDLLQGQGMTTGQSWESASLESEGHQNDQTIRQTAIGIHLRMFLEMLSTVDEKVVEKDRWPLQLATCLQALEFKRCFITFDLQDRFYSPAWHQQVVLRFWEEFSLHWAGDLSIVIAVRKHIYPHPPLAVKYVLEWTDKDLENLLTARWIHSGSRQPLRSLFQGNAFDLLLHKAEGNPRRLLEMTYTLKIKADKPQHVSEADVVKLI